MTTHFRQNVLDLHRVLGLHEEHHAADIGGFVDHRGINGRIPGAPPPIHPDLGNFAQVVVVSDPLKREKSLLPYRKHPSEAG